MKKSITRLICVMLLAIVLTACGNENSKVNQVLQSQMQEASDNPVPSINSVVPSINSLVPELPIIEGDILIDEMEKEKVQVSEQGDTIDVDLTKLSSTMVYSEVYNMMYIPEIYIGKVVRMKGAFVVYTNQDWSQFYPAVVIADATACCSQGLEFILEGNPPLSEGYPEENDVITVVGTFETYAEDGEIYCRLQNARIER